MPGRAATLRDVGDVAAFVASVRARTMTASAVNIGCGAIVDQEANPAYSRPRGLGTLVPDRDASRRTRASSVAAGLDTRGAEA